MNLLSCTKQKAFSLIETAIVLGVVGLVIGGIWSAAAAVNENQKWSNTEAGWLYYLHEITRQFNIQNTPAGPTDIQSWLEVATTPPRGWTGKRSDTNNPLTYLPRDPFGNRLTAQLVRYGGIHPTISLGYSWQTIPTGQCAKLFVMIYKISKAYPLWYISALPTGCSPNASRTIDYYLNSSCCPSSSSGYSAYFELPYQ